MIYAMRSKSALDAFDLSISSSEIAVKLSTTLGLFAGVNSSAKHFAKHF
jgi:hypothetical protein